MYLPQVVYKALKLSSFPLSINNNLLCGILVRITGLAIVCKKHKYLVAFLVLSERPVVITTKIYVLRFKQFALFQTQFLTVGCERCDYLKQLQNLLFRSFYEHTSHSGHIYISLFNGHPHPERTAGAAY